MANKEVMIVPPEDLKVITATQAALVAYDFVVKNAGKELEPGSGEEADFIQSRNNKGAGWRDLDELRRFFETAAKSIKEGMKHVWNVGSWDDLPDSKELKVSWSKQSYTYEWACENAPRFVAQKLIESGLVTAEQLFDTLTVNAMCKAAGITTDKLQQMFEGAVNPKPKDRTLSIK